MAKKLDLNKTVYELTQEYPELIEIMAGSGFTEIIKSPCYTRRQDHDDSQRREDEEYLYDGCRDNLDGQRLLELVGEMPDMSSRRRLVWRK